MSHRPHLRNEISFTYVNEFIPLFSSAIGTTDVYDLFYQPVVKYGTILAIDERFNYETITSFSDDVEWICERAAHTRREYARETNGLPPESTAPKISGIPVFVANDLHDDIASRENVVQSLTEKIDQYQLCTDGEGYACDIGWRIPISRVLQNVKDPHEREGLLKKFFAAYVEFAVK